MKAPELARLLAACDAAPRVGLHGYALVADVELLTGTSYREWPLRRMLVGPVAYIGGGLPKQRVVIPECIEALREEVRSIRAGEPRPKRPRAPRPRRPYRAPGTEADAQRLEILDRLLAIADTLPLVKNGCVNAEELARLSGLARQTWPEGWFLVGPKERLPRVAPGVPGGVARLLSPFELERARAEVERLRLSLLGEPREVRHAPGAIPATVLARAIDQLRWTQGQLAKSLGVRTATVHGWVHDRKPVPEWAARHVRFFLRQQAEREARGPAAEG